MGNKPTENPHTGRTHQSKKESHRASVIVALRNAGVIKDVRGLDRGDPQEEFRLEVYSNEMVHQMIALIEGTPTQRRSGSVFAAKLAAWCVNVRLSRHLVSKYRADFTYTVVKDHTRIPGLKGEFQAGQKVVEDVKGRRYGGDQAQRYAVKKTLMLVCHGIEVLEPEGER